MPVSAHEERRDARGVRLALAELLGPDAAHAREAVGAPASLELVEARHLVLARRDDDLAAPLEGHAVLLAEALEQRTRPRAQVVALSEPGL